MKNLPYFLPFLYLTLLYSCSTEETVMDAEGNEYKIKEYDGTVWTTRNLRARKTSTGDSVKYYFPNDDPKNEKRMGLLYDYETACKICPEGWRLPTNADWEALLQMETNNNADRYKDSQYWQNEFNSNKSGFSARPAGYGNNEELDNFFGSKTIFWSVTKGDEHDVWSYILETGNNEVRKATQHPTYAFSVRCVKDN